MLIDRTIEGKLKKELFGEKKVIILYGPRQAGKTTLMNRLKETIQPSHIVSYNGDDLDVQNLFGTPSLDVLKKSVSNFQYLFIDEAQTIPHIGQSLKLLHDNLPIQIIASGSSSFDLANKLNEPLTGRSITYSLYPISFAEMSRNSIVPRDRVLEQLLRFGMYPKVLITDDEHEKEKYLNHLLNNYLYKDILIFKHIRKPKKVIDLLSLLALQIGKEVSIAELATQLKISQPIVEKYLDVLEKMFVLINIRGFSRNLRKEISKISKYYFTDVGLRNALIHNFNPLNLRADVGELFENWFIVERMKMLSNTGHSANFYFWRTYDQKEIDLIEEKDGKLIGYECKWNAQKKVKLPEEWLHTYANSNFAVVNQDNYFTYLE